MTFRGRAITATLPEAGDYSSRCRPRGGEESHLGHLAVTVAVPNTDSRTVGVHAGLGLHSTSMSGVAVAAAVVRDPLGDGEVLRLGRTCAALSGSTSVVPGIIS